MRPNPSLQPTRYGWLRQPPRAAELKRYVSGERGLSYQVSPQWATFAAPSGVRGFRTATSCWLLFQARCVATRPLHQAGCPSRKLAASEPPVRLVANTNSSPLPLASAYLREPLLRGTAAGPGWPSTRRSEASHRKAAEPHQRRGCASPPAWCTLAAVPKPAASVAPIGLHVQATKHNPSLHATPFGRA